MDETAGIRQSAARARSVPAVPRQYPLHIHISTLFLALITLIGVLLLGVGYMTSKSLIQSTAQDLTLRIARETTVELQSVLKPVEIAVNALSFDRLTAAGSLSQRMARLGLVRSLLEHSPLLASIYVGYPDGDFILLRHVKSEEERLRLKGPPGTTYMVQSIEHRARPARGVYLYLDGDLRLLGRTEQGDYSRSFDPRERSWYQQAMASTHTVLTSPYLFFSDRQVGITIATRAKTRQGVVIGADIQLQSLGKRLAQQKVSRNSQLALVDAKGTIFAHEDTLGLVHMSVDSQPTLATLDNFGIPILQQIASHVDLHAISNADWFRGKLETEADSWQVAIKDLAIESTNPLLLVIALPEHELLSAVYEQTQLAGIATLLIILLSVPITWLLARSIARPLVALTQETDAIRNFDFKKPLELSSQVAEVNQLAQTMSKMKQTIRDFLDLSAAISAEKNFDQLLPKLLGETVNAAEATSGVLYLCQPDGLVPSCACTPGGTFLSAEELGRLHRLPLDPAKFALSADLMRTAGPLLGRALLRGQVLAAAMTPDDTSALMLTDSVYHGGVMFGLAVPLMNRQLELTGAMILLSSRPSEKDLVSFIGALSGTAAVSLEARALIKEQKELFESFVRLIADAIDTKSAYTGKHCARVPELTRLLAQAACDAHSGPYRGFHMDENDWETLRIASWLHDCGKVTTPEFVVDKATKLETIYNRIHEIRTRFEVLKRDAEIQHLQRVAAGTNGMDSQRRLETELRELDADFATLARYNAGSEELATGQLAELQRISNRTWLRTIDNSLGLSEEERSRLGPTADPGLPVLEQVLSDRPEHRIERTDRERIPSDNRWGFRIKAPELLYNQGELYNLSVVRGTLTDEERYKIKEHIIQTEIMLRALPFPRHLQRVPEIAAAHHEKLDGTGYPKSLVASQLSPQARMLAIADIFEALTASDRPYKHGLKLSQAISIMANMRNAQHIDADIFELFIGSGVYRVYAERFMQPEQIDSIDIKAMLDQAT